MLAGRLDSARMNRQHIKLALYVVLTIATLWTGFNFLAKLKQGSAKADSVTDTNETVQPVAAAPDTNAVVVDTNNVATNGTNAVVASATDTNAPSTNAVAATSTNEPTNVTAATSTAETGGEPQKKGTVRSAASVIGALVKFAAALICLGGLIAYDLSQFFGNRSIDFIFNDDLKGMKDPEYEQAEQAWANGKPLDAIQMMREYLRKHPREQYVALRIAEIYEKDLNNYLAAALEYEQVLTHNLPRERWGWAAIHLCNLYIKLGKQTEAVALLRRIAEEYSETAAAKKARKRLAIYESEGDATTLGLDAPEDPNIPDVAPAPPKTSGRKRVEVKKKAEPEEPPSSLPPGFRPK